MSIGAVRKADGDRRIALTRVDRPCCRLRRHGAVMALVALAAWFPGRRAASIDPLATLPTE